MTRRYIEIEDTGRLVLRSDEVPQPRAGEVLIAVDYAGVNRADVLQRLGLYPVPEDASPIMGLEVSGVVAAVSSQESEAAAEGFKVGDRVCALVHGGGYADFAIARADHCLGIPEGIDSRTAAALPEALLTVWHNVFTLGGLQPGNTVLIHGGASGIGSIGVQLAKQLGSRVLATAGGPVKCARVAELGAEFVADYRDGSLLDTFKSAGFAGKIDVILDLAGGDFTQTNLDLAAPDGRVVCIGVMRGMNAEINLFSILSKRLTLTGSTLRGMDLSTRAAGFRDLRTTVMPLVAQGAITPIIDSVFPLADAMRAHELMQGGSHTGKILLDCRRDAA